MYLYIASPLRDNMYGRHEVCNDEWMEHCCGYCSNTRNVMLDVYRGHVNKNSKEPWYATQRVALINSNQKEAALSVFTADPTVR